MKPTLLAAGSVVTVISLIGLVVSVGVKRRVNELGQISDKEYQGK
jgi:hypothetical protein